MELKRLSFSHKPSKLLYYTKNYFRLIIPAYFYNTNLEIACSKLDGSTLESIKKRVDYYNKLKEPFELSKEAILLSDLKLKNNIKTYFFDLIKYLKYFPSHYKVTYLFGDVTSIPDEPCIVKSRPISEDNQNSVLLNLNKVRHFIFIKNDKRQFQDKQNMLVSRGKVHPSQPHRIKFLEKYFDHPMCNIGMVNRNNLKKEWKVSRMTISEQLRFKFILCLEGNDVASNLKWVMSSNSIAVMPTPKYETWFMEGRLIPDYHYIHIEDDYSNLETKLNYYLNHPEKALGIIENAHAFVDQFKDKRKENLVSLLVLNKYFTKTMQKQ